MFFTLFTNRMIRIFTLQCELFSSCNVSNIASLVSARIEGEGGRAQRNADRPGQGKEGSQEFPNLCGHPLWMTPKSSILKQLEIKILSSHSRFQNIQIDKQNTQRYLKPCNYQYCCIS